MVLALTGCSLGEPPTTPDSTEIAATRSALGGTTITADSASYAAGQTITVTYSGMPGNLDDWIALAQEGADIGTYLRYVQTGGQTSGTVTFHVSTAGSYVARAFPNNTFDLLAETPAFTAAGTAVTTDKSSYVPGETITVTYAGMPGNVDDWIGIALPGAAGTSYLKYQYVVTGGRINGTATFTLAGGGTYVARAFPLNGFDVLAETASFSVAGTEVATDTDKTTYAPGETITVTYDGLPGFADDWIALARVGSPNTSYLSYALTGGATSGTVTFTAPGAGSYVARAFPNNSYNLQGQSATFTVYTTSVSVDKASYATGETISVSYSGMPGNVDDWLAIAPVGADVTSYVAFVQTNGQTSGTATFIAPDVGSYVVRAFPSNNFYLLAQSSSFSVLSVSVTADKTSYAAGDTITVTYAGLPGNADDWIALAPAGSATTSYVKYVLTNGQTSGTATFILSSGGSYVARAFPHNSYDLVAESQSFDVTTTAPPSPTVTTDKTSYAAGETITVTYTGLPGYADDWIALAPDGSGNTAYVAYVLTGGHTSGTVTFTLSTAGSYVARSFPNNTYNLVAASSTFTVTTP